MVPHDIARANDQLHAVFQFGATFEYLQVRPLGWKALQRQRVLERRRLLDPGVQGVYAENLRKRARLSIFARTE